ncbi:hypothetical protein ACFPM0_03500 [Pseudonocardia sulfidoxydans]|uniref:hypothetical protein n=1 Tax=Pseudonocardia sulfidoxydans TaxID=54011 RepID=UPI0036199056
MASNHPNPLVDPGRHRSAATAWTVAPHPHRKPHATTAGTVATPDCRSQTQELPDGVRAPP